LKLSACLLALSLGCPISLSALPPQAVACEESSLKTSLSPAQAKVATEILLKALVAQDANAIHQQLSEPLRNNTSVERIEQRLQSRAQITASRIVDLAAGIDDTTVEAVVMTDQGELPLVIVLDNKGHLLAWKISSQALPIEQSAIDFVSDLTTGRWVAARSKLEINFQDELQPKDLKRKWTKLDRVTGGFVKVKDAIVASQGGEQQLVLVTIEFGDLTDNLFIIFNRQGDIINVDFSPDLV